MIKLSDFNHLRSDPRIKFKEETINNEQLTIICYMIADSELWKDPVAGECRGIVFNSKGECICWPLHKFFNIGERPETQQNVLDFEGAVMLEKRDGSMLTPVLVNEKLVWKTKKSFTSDVAISASKNAPENVTRLSKLLLGQGFTPIFEYTDSQHQIVIDYGVHPAFVLLHARNMYSGEYMNRTQLQQLARTYNVPLIGVYEGKPHKLIAELDTMKNFEGYVVIHSNGQWTKAKSKWYLLNHRIMTELRERDVALAVLEETVDDIKSLIVSEGKDINPIIDIEKRVMLQLQDTLKGSRDLCELLKQEPSRKDAALKYQKDPLFSLAMKLYVGSEPDWKKHWRANHHKNYTLRVIYNQHFSGDE
jgi:RNA ligase